MVYQTAPKPANPKGTSIALQELTTASSSSSSGVATPWSLENDQHDRNDPNGQSNGVPPNRLALAQEISPAEFSAASKSLRRKLDLRLMLMAWTMFVFNFFDRVSGPIRVSSVDDSNTFLVERNWSCKGGRYAENSTPQFRTI